MENDLFLQLGRLDGRLANSPARALWTVRMQVRAIAHASVAAGIPVDTQDVERWIAGGGDLPRRREGLNDPLRLSTVAHLTLAASTSGVAAATQSASDMLALLFDHRSVALETAPEELVELMPVLRTVLACASQHGDATWGSAAKQTGQFVKAADVDLSRAITVTDPLERKHYLARTRPTAWLATIAMPVAFLRLGFTQTLMPSLVPPLRVIHQKQNVEKAISAFVARETTVGLAELTRLERGLVLAAQSVSTARSRAGRAAAFRLVFPSITGKRLAMALGATPQGGSYLLRRLAAA